jgi:hypothetical protein
VRVDGHVSPVIGVGTDEFHVTLPADNVVDPTRGGTVGLQHPSAG